MSFWAKYLGDSSFPYDRNMTEEIFRFPQNDRNDRGDSSFPSE